jgi:hypothetical protein
LIRRGIGVRVHWHNRFAPRPASRSSKAHYPAKDHTLTILIWFIGNATVFAFHPAQRRDWQQLDDGASFWRLFSGSQRS